MTLAFSISFQLYQHSTHIVSLTSSEVLPHCHCVPHCRLLLSNIGLEEMGHTWSILQGMQLCNWTSVGAPSPSFSKVLNIETIHPKCWPLGSRATFRAARFCTFRQVFIFHHISDIITYNDGLIVIRGLGRQLPLTAKGLPGHWPVLCPLLF